MRLFIVLGLVVLSLIYTAFVYTTFTEPKNAKLGMSNSAKTGKMLFQKYNCTSCHQIYGLGGYLGPDLTNISKIRKKEAIYTIIKNGTAKMPNYQLKDQEVNSLLAYFDYINISDSLAYTSGNTYYLKNE